MWVLREEDAPLSQMSDGQLVRAALAGDEQAFEVLTARYRFSLFRYITVHIESYDIACDVLQQVLVQFYLSLPLLEQERSLRPWLFQVTRRKIIDEVRRKKWVAFSELKEAEEERLSLLPDPALLPEAQVERLELQLQLRAALASLPKRYRQVVYLRYLGQLSFPEISRLMGIPQGTAKTHAQRARPLLRAALRAARMAELLPEG